MRIFSVVRNAMTIFSKSCRYRFKRWFRRMVESIGVELWTHPGLAGLDRKVLPYLPARNGFFIEVGAHNGYAQSNTYYLERFRNWRGILVEPVPEQFRECVRERRRSRVVQCALVPMDYASDQIRIFSGSLVSNVEGVWGQAEQQKRIEYARHAEKEVSGEWIVVPARTLTSILEECSVESIDFFSLDVEGFELEVLQGLDFSRWRPEYILIEANHREEIIHFMEAVDYKIVDEFNTCDILFKTALPR